MAPSGWPRAIPEPLGFTLSGSKPSSPATAHACAAKASFDDVDLVEVKPGALQRDRHRGDGSDPHHGGVDAGMPPRDDAR